MKTQLSKNTILILVSSVLTIAIAAYATFRLLYPSTSARATRVSQLDKSIRSELPNTATKAQVKSWFQRHKISYDYMDGKKHKLDDESFVVESGVPVKKIGGVLTGGFSVPAEQLFEDNCSVNIAFFMNKHERAIKHQVGWTCGGL